MTLEALPHGNIELLGIDGSCDIKMFELDINSSKIRKTVETMEWENPRGNCQYQSYQYQIDQRLPLFPASSAG